MDIKKGDSGSWVVDTSDPIHYKVIGSAVATSDGAAHFVGLVDQFSEILESTGNAGPISLVPPFRALVNCANLAFLSSDPRCDDFIDEALSPVVLEQCTKEWYMSGLKSILSVQNHSTSSGKGGHFPEQSNPARRLVVKSLLLEYGIELLDSLLEPSDFISSHRSEFSTPQWQALRVLQDVLLQSRTKEVEHLKRVRVVDKAPRRTSSGLPICKRTVITLKNLTFGTLTDHLFSSFVYICQSTQTRPLGKKPGCSVESRSHPTARTSKRTYVRAYIVS